MYILLETGVGEEKWHGQQLEGGLGGAQQLNFKKEKRLMNRKEELLWFQKGSDFKEKRTNI